MLYVYTIWMLLKKPRRLGQGLQKIIKSLFSVQIQHFSKYGLCNPHLHGCSQPFPWMLGFKRQRQKGLLHQIAPPPPPPPTAQLVHVRVYIIMSLQMLDFHFVSCVVLPVFSQLLTPGGWNHKGLLKEKTCTKITTYLMKGFKIFDDKIWSQNWDLCLHLIDLSS